jgi:hypothetical protein
MIAARMWAPAASCSAIQAAVGCKASTASHTKRPDADLAGPCRSAALRGWR